MKKLDFLFLKDKDNNHSVLKKVPCDATKFCKKVNPTEYAGQERHTKHQQQYSSKQKLKP